MILIGILSTTLIILIYYQKKVVELPQVFCGKSMLDIVNRIPLLKRKLDGQFGVIHLIFNSCTTISVYL